MFSIQGQQCVVKKSKNLKKKPIQISLFINKTKEDKVEIRRERNANSSQDRKCFFHLDTAERQDKRGNSNKSASKKFTRTPTPTQNSRISYLEYEFEPPKAKITGPFLFCVQGKDRQSSSWSRRRRSLKSEENTDRKSNFSMQNRITMQDLGVNLPSIIRSKKVKQKNRYRPQLAEDIFSCS
jgi:hypothetical protein